ncbi:PREDICTED: potassium channel KOR1-like [Prunus mume]|uniref:Potassium channel n=1 Tax=Prunus mume TaxID=102107 RepID=A0ABM1LY02_PRUMU|nr:PREDICTED: potassium channel KOR1-like [Prunus mume]
MSRRVAEPHENHDELKDEEEEYEVQDIKDRIKSSRGSRFNLITNELGLDDDSSSILRRFSRQSLINGVKGLSHGVIHPDNWWYRAWTKFILVWAVYSSFFTPFEFGFFRGLEEKLFIMDVVGQVAFLLDIILQFFLAYRDGQTYRMVYKRTPIALRYLKSNFIIDLLGCMPWDNIYKVCGRREEVRYLLWIRLSRVRKVTKFFKDLEKDIRINYNFTRVIKLLVVELYCTHTAACIFYYLATTLPASQEGYTWIGSLKLGDYSYSNFRDIDLWKRYTTSMYFAIVTMATVGKLLFKYLFNEYNRILLIISVFIFPASIRAKISHTLYFPYIESVPLFKGCSAEFINQIVIKLHEEFFLPGEVIMEPGNVVDQLYFVCHGLLEVVGIVEDGTEETVSQLEPNSSFGEISILCNIPQLYTVRVRELCRLLRLDKQSFTSILDIYFYDGRKILNNLLEGAPRIKQLESDITFHIGKQEAELALKVNSAAYHGDLFQLKGLIRAGADPNKTDYDGRSPLHLAALRGHEDIALFLIQEGVDINIKDTFGNTPLLEAIKNGNDRVSSLLIKEGASLKMDNAGSFICTAITKGDSDFIKRLLSNGIDPNSKDYDHRTPLHVAASEGLYMMAKLLLEAGASVFSKDRWGNTPLDEGQMCGNKNLIKLLEEATATQLTESPYRAQELADKLHPKKCTVFPFHPWEGKEQRRPGIVLWVPTTIQGLIKTATDLLEFSSGSFIILSEDGGKILDVDLINDGQKLYLVSDTHLT